MVQYKLQVACFIIAIYIWFTFRRNRTKEQIEGHSKLFEHILIVSVIYYIFDIATVYSVNHLDQVSPYVNRGLHLVYLISIESLLFLLFRYMLMLCQYEFSSKLGNMLSTVPYIISVITAVACIERLHFIEGKTTNYSMGTPAYACYSVGIVYFVISIIIFLKRWNYIEHNKAVILRFSFLIVLGGLVFQIIFPESLVSSGVVTMMLLTLYIQVENNAIREMENMYEDSVHSFADIVESRDGSTGEHIKRCTIYVQIIAEEMRKKNQYAKILTKDYINDLVVSAPIHDIGKIAIPDAILQKPGALTEEEYRLMKEHTVRGAELIKKSFAKQNEKYHGGMMHDVALYHHERWDGEGYPMKRAGEEIPLAARIMAVADVFDAVSQDRCYREAMSLEESFAIILEGRGTQFDPDVVDCFLAAKNRVITAYQSLV